VIRGIYVEDRNKDTLLYLETLRINVALLKLIRHRMDIENLSLENLTGRVFRRLPDNRFNFQFIIDAFAPKDTIPEDTVDKKRKPWEISARKIVLKNINARYFDDVAGIDARLNLDELNLKVKTLDIPGLVFKGRELFIQNMDGNVEMWKVKGNNEKAVAEIQMDDETYKPEVATALDRLLMEKASLEFRYRDYKQHFAADIGTLSFTKGQVNLNTNRIGVERLSLLNADLLASLPVTSIDTLRAEPESIAAVDSIPVSDILDFFPPLFCQECHRYQNLCQDS